jgi:C4-dicarboxylate-specific signal transduction histidine kinase
VGDTSPISLDRVVITSELCLRTRRRARLKEENRALRELAQCFANTPERVLQQLAESAIQLCRADTAGISLESTAPDGNSIFRWVALAGGLKELLGGTTPRNFSPCGVCVDRGTPQLFSHPERFFTYFESAPLPIVEGLLIPWHVEAGPTGTIWIIAHDDKRKFDAEDIRVMSSLADFAASALRYQSTQEALRKAESLAMAASLAHQINNPLQAILSAICLVQRQGKLEANSREFLRMAEQQVSRVTELTGQILKLERPPTTRLTGPGDGMKIA